MSQDIRNKSDVDLITQGTKLQFLENINFDVYYVKIEIFNLIYFKYIFMSQDENQTIVVVCLYEKIIKMSYEFDGKVVDLNNLQMKKK
jgi:hypothetical protein